VQPHWSRPSTWRAGSPLCAEPGPSARSWLLSCQRMGMRCHMAAGTQQCSVSGGCFTVAVSHGLFHSCAQPCMLPLVALHPMSYASWQENMCTCHMPHESSPFLIAAVGTCSRHRRWRQHGLSSVRKCWEKWQLCWVAAQVNRQPLAAAARQRQLTQQQSRRAPRSIQNLPRPAAQMSQQTRCSSQRQLRTTLQRSQTGGAAR
jgi:hypothetical protein